jgi:hypothetical protein
MGEWRYRSTHSLTLTQDGGEWSASCSGHFTPTEIVPGTHWIGGWVGPRSILDAVVKKKIPSPCQESNPRTPFVQPTALLLYQLSYPTSLLPNSQFKCCCQRMLVLFCIVNAEIIRVSYTVEIKLCYDFFGCHSVQEFCQELTYITRLVLPSHGSCHPASCCLTFPLPYKKVGISVCNNNLK